MLSKQSRLAALFTVLLSCSLWAYSGGDGTASNPYQIATVADWEELMANYWDWNGKYFILTNDIDFNGAALTPIGKIDWNYAFNSFFDGQNHIVSKAVIYKPSSDYVGLFGYVGSNGQIHNLGVENITITGKSFVGSLCGLNYGTIRQSYATGNVTGAINEVGGLCGHNSNGGTISQSYAVGPVTGETSIGGLCGWNEGTISHSYATGDVSGNEAVGGLTGFNSYSVTECYATGNVTGAINFVGGLCGRNGGPISGCYATGSVSGNYYVGGLCGWNSDTISGSYAVAAVDGSGNRVGGLCGGNLNGTIRQSYATGNVTGAINEVGGLCGHNSGTISDSYASGSVTGAAVVGGLCGQNNDYGLVSSCYSTGFVSGMNAWVGGLIGYNDNSTVSFCYATGTVNGTASGSTGGLMGGNNLGTVTFCFWDTDTSNTSTGIGNRLSPMGISGKTTEEMKTLTTFADADWDITDVYNTTSIWKMPFGDYPRLAWEDLPAYLTLSNIPNSISIGTGETTSFTFNVSRIAAEEPMPWTAQADSVCPWISDIMPDFGTASSPQDGTSVTVTVDAGALEPGDYTNRLWIHDDYFYYEVIVPMVVFNRINAEELILLASCWLMNNCNSQQPCSQADWYIDGTIDLHDFNQLAQSWLGEEILLDRPGIHETFESGTFTALPWQHGGNTGWIIADDVFYEGAYAARSGTITDFQTSTLSLTIDETQGNLVDAIRFARKVSSEQYYDYLRFYIDGIEVAQWSGEQDWAVASYTFTPGSHSFTWSYTKDGSESIGSDSAWIDAISIYKQP